MNHITDNASLEYVTRFTIEGLISFDTPFIASEGIFRARENSLQFTRDCMIKFAFSSKVFDEVNAITPVRVSTIVRSRFGGADIMGNEISNEKLIQNWGKEYELLKLSGIVLENPAIEFFSPLDNDNVFILSECRSIMDLMQIK